MMVMNKSKICDIVSISKFLFFYYFLDYAFLEIQGNPRYPGLNIWYNNGEKHEANYPKDVCLI